MSTETQKVDVSGYAAVRIARANFIKWCEAKRRRALKRWLRAHGVKYSDSQMYDESALRKLVRDKHAALARVGGAA